MAGVRQGLWFPIVLALLVLLALPGLVLLALSVAGLEGATNGWLQGRMNLSYHNSLPVWASLVLLFLPVLLVLLYFLKLRRAALVVPSTYLWRKSIEDLHVNSLFQWLRNNVLLLVQLAIILLLIYSSLSFQFRGQTTTTGKHYILIIDSSASMSATDVSPSRLEEAKSEALREIDASGRDDTGMVIEFNSRATLLQPYTRDKGLLRAAVQRIVQTQRPTRIDEALALADSLANPHRSTDDEAVRPDGEDPAEARTYVSPDGIAAEVHLFSDGGFPDVPNFAAGNLSLIYHRIGKAGADAVNNVAIVGFNAVRDENDPAKLQVFVRVANYRSEETEVTVELEWTRDKDFSALEQTATVTGRKVEPADEKTGTPAKDTPGEGALTFAVTNVDNTDRVVLHARLKKMRDDFSLDDEAWLVAGEVRKARVLFVTPGNEILKTFFDLEETSAVAKVDYLTPNDLNDEAKYRRPALAGEYDFVLFDRCAPAKEDDLPLGNTFFIASVPPPWKWSNLKPLDDALIRNPTSKDALMQSLTGLDEIGFVEARRFDLSAKGVPSRVPRLLETDRDTAVLFALPRRSFVDLVLMFPLVNDKGEWTTNWYRKASFPLFLRNVLYQLGHVSDLAADENVSPGQVKVIRPDSAVEKLEIVDPAGSRKSVARGTGQEFAFRDTERVGVYRAVWKDGERGFAVNLLDADESNIQPRDEIKIGSQTVVAGQERRQVYDTWKWVALGALLLLVLEWAVYHRRAWF